MAVSEDWGSLSDPDVIEARDVYYNIGIRPLPKDRYAQEQWNMAQLHTCVMNRLEGVYKNATHIAPHDFHNYWAVAYDAVHFLHEHHETEEGHYFPYFDGGNLMIANENQHAEFAEPILETLAYLDSVNPSKPEAQPFFASKFRASVDRWLVTAAKHMAAELGTLDAEHLKRSGVTVHDMDTAKEDVGKHTMSTQVLKYSLPAIMAAVPRDFDFPRELPWWGKFILTPMLAYCFGYGRMKYYWNAKRWEKTAPNPPS
ncbi:hypothetical protein DACRYDRAFT_105503 [Dacryopinax primogenitus]|uniref:Hemerythrin-like domain-containing protein n=1 Tax=Dacryopinax primogenitus (strain DJM 731) TaxID=1858805 RepID=M5GFU5_DACPD|nr:uncharacterized protein DACRYDRAFT_105503 [Dacryopinax primogenitus]EJU04443.1 hypothetical protein DACRYDRAFT_105503 [Dacryopinax primogenitus]